MKFIFIALMFTLLPLGAEQAQFTPPKGWKVAEMDKLPPHVKVMVVGEGKLEFPPSMNLSTEQYTGTLEDYLKIVKKISDDNEAEWKDLGTVKTSAGEGRLSQTDTLTPYGRVRMMHVIVLNNQNIYILTASSLRDEFSSHYKEFFDAFRSFTIKPTE